MRELVTTLLDAVGLGLVAAGAAAAVFPLVGWAGLALAGGVVLAGSWWAARPARPAGDGR
ncbi:hypothetical protein SAMN04489712_105270 [Thermomonospora echinospora]|uniref:Uncharacterized protein n=1 Tax=Thermomonospora echinospora TaxID=1992 RepID=A0A1H6A9Q0_9ACTN|nr:hypothetical protein [Thermomonospora echinospora]SEG44777.1 hypothetical protein SAMN04489712_105270 [Thermomonospora echinospora]